MARTLDDVIKELPLDQQQEIEAQAARLIEDEMTLRDLRRDHALTQERMAEVPRISQDGLDHRFVRQGIKTRQTACGTC